MNGRFVIEWSKGAFAGPLSPLEMARIMADRKGFSTVDAAPTGIGEAYRIKAYTDKGACVSVNGSSLTEAVSKLIERIS